MRSLFHRAPQAIWWTMAGALIGITAQAQNPAPSSGPVATPSEVVRPVTASMTSGEVRRIDLANQKITLRHDAIDSLNMPPMTMVFKVSDKGLLESLKPGDAVRFVAEKRGGEYWVTVLQPAP